MGGSSLGFLLFREPGEVQSPLIHRFLHGSGVWEEALATVLEYKQCSKSLQEMGYQLLCSSGAVALVLWKWPVGVWTKPARYLGDLEQPQWCFPSALHGSVLTPSKEKSRGRWTPNLAFCIAPCRGSRTGLCRYPVPGGGPRMRAWQRTMFRLQIYSCLLRGRKIILGFVQSRSHPAQTWGGFKGSVT